MLTLNWGLKDGPLDWMGPHTWAVLTALLCHANMRYRCWPSITRLTKTSGVKSTATVTKALDWLEDNRALYRVPYAKRIGEEVDLPPRQTVYQLTGHVFNDGVYYSYLYLTPEAVASLKAMEVDILEAKILGGKILAAKTEVVSRDKVTDPSSKGIAPPTGTPPTLPKLRTIQDDPDPVSRPYRYTIKALRSLPDSTNWEALRKAEWQSTQRVGVSDLCRERLRDPGEAARDQLERDMMEALDALTVESLGDPGMGGQFRKVARRLLAGDNAYTVEEVKRAAQSRPPVKSVHFVPAELSRWRNNQARNGTDTPAPGMDDTDAMLADYGGR